MGFKKALIVAGVVTLAAGAAGVAGCGLFGKGKAVTITEKGFSVELTSKFDKLSLPVDDDDILRDNTIINYDNGDILFTVSQIPRDEIFSYHVYDLSTFTTFVTEDYYATDENVYDFKSEDEKLDGCTFSMYYTNSDGYKNVQTDYLFAGSDNFYEVSMVVVGDDFESLAEDIKAIALTCKANDGLNNSADVKAKEVVEGNIRFNLDETYEYDKDDGYYTNDIVYCKISCIDDVKFLTLDGVMNHYRLEYNDYLTETQEAETANGTKYLYCVGVEEEDDYDVDYLVAAYIDDDGDGYLIEYDLIDYDFAGRFFDDIVKFCSSATGTIDNYDGNISAVAKTFTESNGGTKKLGYSLALDDTFKSYGWSDKYSDFSLWSAEYNRIITIEMTDYTTAYKAYVAWASDAPQESYREKALDYEGNLAGLTYDVGKNNQECYYEYALFIETEKGVVVVTLSANVGYFERTPSAANIENLEYADKLFMTAVKDIELNFV